MRLQCFSASVDTVLLFLHSCLRLLSKLASMDNVANNYDVKFVVLHTYFDMRYKSSFLALESWDLFGFEAS